MYMSRPGDLSALLCAAAIRCPVQIWEFKAPSGATTEVTRMLHSDRKSPYTCMLEEDVEDCKCTCNGTRCRSPVAREN